MGGEEDSLISANCGRVSARQVGQQGGNTHTLGGGMGALPI